MTRNWCVKCFKDQEEEAGEECKNPTWHDPNHRRAELERQEQADGVD